MVFPHPQPMLGAPFKPYFGLSGVVALDVLLPVRYICPIEVENSTRFDYRNFELAETLF
jgi:hypothetical protein